jgi:transglutaminase-like putative cysteine protease
MCYANEMWFYDSSYLILDTKLSTNILVTSTSSTPIIDSINANISFFPKSRDNQKIIFTKFIPTPEFSEDNAIFEWKSPSSKNLSVEMSSRVRIDNMPHTINRKISFPIGDVPSDMLIFTKPAEIIDVNEDIIEKASELASGKDDEVEVVDTLAFWVNSNVAYTFETMTAEASQKSSWVMANREGVCDELTSLFISMLRSLGIPARFVAGISYTNSPLFENKWGPHGWAEVYFPGYGWVPYDVTYGEYGWVDPTHIVNKVSNDAGKITSTYQWRSENSVNINVDDLKTSVDVVDIGDPADPDIGMKIDILKDNVNFGSYNLVIASITNLRNYYVSRDIYLSSTNRIKIIGPASQHLLLRPGEVRELRWQIQVDPDLNEEYVYTFPIEIYDLENTTAMTAFTSVTEAEYFSFEDINKTVSMMNGHSEAAYSKNLDVACNLSNNEYYAYEKPSLQCDLKNTGNIFLKSLRICLEDDCGELNLGITQEKLVNFTVRKIMNGENHLVLSINNDQISRIEDIYFMGLDSPGLEISDVEFPASVRYPDRFNLSFIVKKTSISNPQYVKIIVTGPGLKKEYSFAEVNQDLSFSVELRGKHLDEGANNISIQVSYKDKNFKEYSDSENMSVSLIDVTFFQKILMFFNGLFK